MWRGSNWTSVDDVTMCKARLKTSQDPITGTNQKGEAFWKRIMAEIKAKGCKKNRTKKSAQARFSLINAAVSKFVSVHTQQERSAASGTNVEDVERTAFEAYCLNSDGQKSCWYVLRNDPKWASAVNEAIFEPSDEIPAYNQDREGPGDQPQTPSMNVSRESTRTRPIGVKRAKLDLSQAKTVQSQLAAIHEANTLARERAQIMQQQVALGYYRLDESTIPMALQEHFLNTRTKVFNQLDRIQRSNQSQPSDPDPLHGIPNENSPAGEYVSDDEVNNAGENVNEIHFGEFTTTHPYEEGETTHFTVPPEETRTTEQHVGTSGAAGLRNAARNLQTSYVNLNDYDLTLGF